MFKGVSTLHEYEECLKRGLCEEHAKEISENEFAGLKNEFPRKAFRYIRINILYPLLFKKTPKCEKIKMLMEKTPALSKIFLGGDISESANAIFILDSVVIFTLCHLSKICCIGALFHMKKKNSEDPKLKSLRALLLVDQLDKTVVQYLYPILQKNFSEYDSDIIKASHIITLIFVRNFCSKFNMKTAIENIEKDIKGDMGWEKFKTVADMYYKKEKYEDAANSYVLAVMQNLYSTVLYTQLAGCYLKLKKYKASQLYAYLAVGVDPTHCEAYCLYTSSLIKQKLYHEAFQVINYALESCEKSHYLYGTLSKFKKEMDSTYFNCDKKELVSRTFEISVTLGDSAEKKFHVKPQSVSVKLIDSDSAESESECEVKKIPKVTDTVDLDESETVEKKQGMSTQEKRKSKPSCTTKKKRTSSEGSADILIEEELDVTKINSLLKEASEALLADCGYKAVQIFRGPLRDFIESSKLTSFEECDIVCIRYSYGIAYCKSGGYDDLQKSITILKDIVENYDSITFPAAYYSLGLVYRKLNRFKEALNYLEVVKSFLSKGIHFKVYPWPGMTTVIQETKSDTLKILVQDLIKECENPPNPDAFCRYISCENQPIYYTDPDFKGYISLSCSEQCCLQYHLQCWKAIKTEKDLTDKEFLEKACFTPDCEGVIIKIQNIDKKGDLGKEFTSDLKKASKQKFSKWEKKTDCKEKKRKKLNSKSEEGIQEISENERNCSRKNSNVDDEASQFSGSNDSTENTANKSENIKSFHNSKEVIGFNTSSQNNIIRSLSENSVQEIPVSGVPEQEMELNDVKRTQGRTSEFMLTDCIKNNVYSFMADFLQQHGPLKINDVLLTEQLSCFPDEVLSFLEEYGGIGEFLKDDLRFAYVGDLYVCVISDLAVAYKMCSSSCLPTDFKSLESLENTDDSKYSNEFNMKTVHQSFGLNPDALEYTPVESSKTNKNNHYKLETNNSFPQDLNECNSTFLPGAFEPSSKCVSDIQSSQSSTIHLNTFPETEIYVNKSKSCEAILNSKFCDVSESIFCTSTHSEKEFCDNPSCVKISDEHTSTTGLSFESTNSDSKVKIPSLSEYSPQKDKKFCTELENMPCDGLTSSVCEHFSKLDKLEVQLLSLLKLYHSDEMDFCRQNIDSYLKPYVIKKLPELATSGTVTDVNLLEKNNIEENITRPDVLKEEINQLSEQNLSLHNEIKCATEQQQKLNSKVAELQKLLADSTAEIEVLKREYDKKEQELMNEKKCLMESLTEAHKTVDKQKISIASLMNENNSLQKSVNNLTLSLKESEEKIKNTLDTQEKKFNNNVLNLQNENAELRSRAKYAELQVLHLKKNEYLKKIEEKSAEAVKKRKELTDGLSMVSCNLNPVLQSNMKALSAKLLSYVNDLNGIKLDFMRTIDKEIEKVKNGTSLQEISDIEMKELPGIPCWKYSFPANGPTLDKHAYNSTQLPFNFGFNTGTAPQISSTAVLPPATPVISPGLSLPKVLPTVVSTAKVVAPVTPAAAVISPPTPSANLSNLLSEPSVLEGNKTNKVELSNGTLDFTSLNPQIQESFKSAMASINSFASSPYLVPTLDEEFDKKCVVFRHPDPVLNNTKDIPKVPPGIQNTLICSASERMSSVNSISEPAAGTACSSGEKSCDSLDAIPRVKVNPVQNTWELEKKKTVVSKNSYEKLLNKLKEQFPQYNQEQLISFVKEFRSQRQGKLSGLPMDTIIKEISDIIMKKKMAEKKVSELKVLSKSTKVLVNKKLVPDPKPVVIEPQTMKKKSAWGNIESDLKRRFSGSPDDDCIICCDPMTNDTAYKVACGHIFHEKCIREWLKNKSNCPVCRVLLLLPEEYPSLS